MKDNIKKTFVKYIIMMIMILGIGAGTEVFASPITLDTTTSGSCSININGTTYHFNPTGTNFEGMTTISNDVTSDGIDASNADFVVGGTYYKIVNPGRFSSYSNIDNLYIGGNVSTVAGGVMSIPSNQRGGRVSGSNFVGNSVTGTGTDAGVLAFAASVQHTIENSMFKGNSATRNGGVLTMTDNSRLTINNTKFFNNSADRYGGAIYNNGGRGLITIDSSQFIGNTAGANGGAIYSNAANTTTINVSGSQFGDSSTSGETDSIWLNGNTNISFQTSESSLYSKLYLYNNSAATVSTILNLYGQIIGPNSTLTVDAPGRLNLKSGSVIENDVILTLSGTLGLERDLLWLQSYTTSGTPTIDISSGSTLTYNVDSSASGTLSLPNITGNGSVKMSGLDVVINNVSDDTQLFVQSGSAEVSVANIDSAKLGRYTLGNGSDSATLTVKTTNGGQIGNQNQSLLAAASTDKNTVVFDNNGGSGEYVLADIAKIGTVEVKNATVLLENYDLYQNNKYVFTNSTIDLIDDTTGRHTFSNVDFGTGTGLKVDVELLPAAADTLVINSGSGKLNLIDINILGSVSNDYLENFEIISGSAVTAGAVTLSIDSSVLGESSFGLGETTTVTNNSKVGIQKVSEYINATGNTFGITVQVILKDTLAAINQA